MRFHYLVWFALLSFLTIGQLQASSELWDTGLSVANCATHLSLAASRGEPWMGTPVGTAGIYGQAGEVYLTGTAVLFQTGIESRSSLGLSDRYAVAISEQVRILEQTSASEFRFIRPDQLTPIGPRNYIGLVDGEIRLFRRSLLFGWQSTNDMAHAFWKSLLIPIRRAGIRPGTKPPDNVRAGDPETTRLREVVNQVRQVWSDSHRGSQMLTSGTEVSEFETSESLGTALSALLPMGTPLEVIPARSNIKLPNGEKFVAVRAFEAPRARRNSDIAPIPMPNAELSATFVALGITNRQRVVRIPILANSGDPKQFADDNRKEFSFAAKGYERVEPISFDHVVASTGPTINVHDLNQGTVYSVTTSSGAVSNLQGYELPNDGRDHRRLLRVWWSAVSDGNSMERIYSMTIDQEANVVVDQPKVRWTVVPGERVLGLAASGRRISEEQFLSRDQDVVGASPGVATQLDENTWIEERVDVLVHDGMVHPEKHLAPPFVDSTKQNIAGRSPFQVRTIDVAGLIPILTLSRYVYEP